MTVVASLLPIGSRNVVVLLWDLSPSARLRMTDSAAAAPGYNRATRATVTDSVTAIARFVFGDEP